MAIKIDTHKLDNVKPTDALPLLFKVRNFIFGKKKPDGFTRVVFYINLFGWFVFTLWASISYFAIALKDLISENKGISIAAIVRRRGRQLGFGGEEFLQSFKQFQFIDIFIWTAIFVSIIFLYRKKKIFGIIFFASIVLHFLLLFFMLGVTYFLEDVSFFDKALYAVMIILSLIYIILLNKENNHNVD